MMYSTQEYEDDEKQVLALQSTETLNTIIGDEDLGARLEPFLGDILLTFNEFNLKLNSPLYFELLMELVRCYSEEIAE
jgi:hypothetical protein